MGDELEVLARNKFRERVLATPAIAENKIYLRTVRHLYSIGEGEGEGEGAGKRRKKL